MKQYVLDMFPYPSGAGLHVGHVEGYTGTDVYARYMRMKGYAVLHPMGWDAFGLPAENFAIKNKIAPAESTKANIDTFRRQIKQAGLSYDWDREIDASDPEYYRWTQWIFILLWKQGLAYKKKAPANWCPSCQTVLANEQVVDERCERCDTMVTQKDLEQWFFKITDYGDRLIGGLEGIDWPKSTKLMQKNWIGRKEGRKIKFGDIEVFTTKPETIMGVTFIAVAPEHSTKVRNGDTGVRVKHPITGHDLPVWVADYVLANTGTGAIMGVPAGDERDMQFAKTFGLPVKEYELHSGEIGEPMVTYHLRDWLVSRQRYWGAPIPMVWCDKCSEWNPVPEEELPVRLPTDVDFKPTGQSPIALSKSFQAGAKCPKCGGVARREVDTMDTFVDSSWYFLRFCSPKNKKQAWNKEEAGKWMPVDLYVGGAEHTVLHLMYSRFFYKVFYDLGLVDKSGGDEPFLKLRHQGTILGEDSRKMSKRWGNVINPDDVVAKFGADTLRMYELFMGPFEATKPWNTSGVEGISRFLHRVEKLFDKAHKEEKKDEKEQREIHKLIKKVGEDIESMSFNTAIAAMMTSINEVTKSESNIVTKYYWERFVKVLAPFAPFLAEELWARLGHKESVHKQNWPEFDPTMVETQEATIVIQVNGKVRSSLLVDKDSSEEVVKKLAVNQPNVQRYLTDNKYTTVYIPGRVLNFVLDGQK